MYLKGGMFMDDINKRFIQLRKTLKLNQRNLGDSLGLSNSGVSNIENGIRNVTDQHIRLLQSNFNVNEDWLRHGNGDMFLVSDDTIIAELANEYKLSAIDKEILTHFLQMDKDTRELLTNEIVSLSEKISSIDEVDPIEEEVNSYRMELEAQKKTAEKSTRYDIGKGKGS